MAADGRWSTPPRGVVGRGGGPRGIQTLCSPPRYVWVHDYGPLEAAVRHRRLNSFFFSSPRHCNCRRRRCATIPSSRTYFSPPLLSAATRRGRVSHAAKASWSGGFPFSKRLYHALCEKVLHQNKSRTRSTWFLVFDRLVIDCRADTPAAEAALKDVLLLVCSWF